MKEIGQFRAVNIRDICDQKETEFTKWLAQNPKFLGDAIGISVADLWAEQSTGNFRVDLVGRDELGNTIVVENQFGDSNHDHLGKLITYLAASKAMTAVWIVERARPEHVEAIGLLNQLQTADFYLLSLEAAAIGNSLPALKLTLIMGPGDEITAIPNENHTHFWNCLIEQLRKRQIALPPHISPGNKHWFDTKQGLSGLMFCYVILRNSARIELYIDRYPTEAENEVLFRHFHERSDQIKNAFGQPLEWGKLEGKRGFRIAYTISIGGLLDIERWDEIQTEMIAKMVKFQGILRLHFDKLVL